jgi:hypothetical protein
MPGDGSGAQSGFIDIKKTEVKKNFVTLSMHKELSCE